MTGYTFAQDAVDPTAIPANVLACGYTTGAGIAWPASGWQLHPNAVRICQDASASDTTADVLDVETGAATPADVPVWFPLALANFKRQARTGQRYPCIYVNRSNISAVANALTAAGITANGPALWLAKPGDTPAQAEANLTDTGPYPMVGEQYTFATTVDFDVFTNDWVYSTDKFAVGGSPIGGIIPLEVGLVGGRVDYVVTYLTSVGYTIGNVILAGIAGTRGSSTLTPSQYAQHLTIAVTDPGTGVVQIVAS